MKGEEGGIPEQEQKVILNTDRGRIKWTKVRQRRWCHIATNKNVQKPLQLFSQHLRIKRNAPPWSAIFVHSLLLLLMQCSAHVVWIWMNEWWMVALKAVQCSRILFSTTKKNQRCALQPFADLSWICWRQCKEFCGGRTCRALLLSQGWRLRSVWLPRVCF